MAEQCPQLFSTSEGEDVLDVDVSLASDVNIRMGVGGAVAVPSPTVVMLSSRCCAVP